MNRRIIPLILVLIFLLAPLFGYGQQPVKLVILHTNDMHSRLDGFAPSLRYSPLTTGDDNTMGGFSRLATLIERERSADPAHTLVVDAGDFLMGTIYHYMEEYNGFQLPLMSDMGYEVVAIGNHEFDYGPETLAQIIEKSKESKIPQLLLGNATFDKDDQGDDRLEALFENKTILPYTVVEKDGIRIGLFSLMGKDADDVAPFAPPVKFTKQIRAARKLTKSLRRTGTDVVICLSHSGLMKNKKGEWSGEDVKLAKRVKGLDLVISAHTHTKLPEALMVKGVPIVQTGSYAKFLGRVELNVSGSGVKLVDYRLIPVDDSVEGDMAVQARIDEQKEKISSQLFEPLGYSVDSVLVESSFELLCDEYGGDLDNSNLGPLVVDAIHKYVNSKVEGGTDVSMVAAGVIRDPIVPGSLTVQDIFRVMSLGSGDDNIPGYPLSRVYVTGIELKRIIEVLLVAYKSSPSNFCYYAGLKVNFDPDKRLLKKVQSIAIIGHDGSTRDVDFSKDNPTLYSIAANAYMLQFVGVIKKTTFGLVNVIPKDASGNEITDMSVAVMDFDSQMKGVQEGKEWIALTGYLAGMGDTDEDGIADIDLVYEKPEKRIIPQINQD